MAGATAEVSRGQRAGGVPRASMRACSYHASPGACQANALCTSLWMIWVNRLVNHYIAVDGRGCGNVDNLGARAARP